MRRLIALAAVLTVWAGASASAAITTFPASVFQQAAGSGGNNLIGNTPATALFNRGATPLGLGYAAPIQTNAIIGERLTLNFSTVTNNTTYVFVRLGRLVGGVFTNANAVGVTTPLGGATTNVYALVTGAGPLTLLLDPFSAACATLGGCNALIVGNSTFSAAGSSFRLSTLTASTPEPGAWALMMLGFGALAFRLKSQRRGAVSTGVAALT